MSKFFYRQFTRDWIIFKKKNKKNKIKNKTKTKTKQKPEKKIKITITTTFFIVSFFLFFCQPGRVEESEICVGHDYPM